MDYLDRLTDDAKVQPGFDEAWEPYRVMGALVDERIRQGLTQREVAAAIGATQASVARMENDPSGVSFGRILRYAKFLQSPIEVGPSPRPAKAMPARGRKKIAVTAGGGAPRR